MIDIHFKDIHTEFQFEMESKFIFLQGDSAIGKTTFFELVAAAELDASLNLGYTNVHAFYGRETELPSLQVLHKHVFVLDEDCIIWERSDVVEVLLKSDNYFIIINRDNIYGAFPIGLDELCTVKQNDSIYTFVSRYNRTDTLQELGECFICEDSGSGFQFLKEVLHGGELITAYGKSNIGRTMRKRNASSYTIVYDRAGIGIDYERIQTYCKKHGLNIKSEIDWDSFEAYILGSQEYAVEFDGYPNKEIAAELKIREIIPEYQKGCLPDELKRPIYWKVKDAVEIIQGSSDIIKQIDVF